jgi:hypothetical protein
VVCVCTGLSVVSSSDCEEVQSKSDDGLVLWHEPSVGLERRDTVAVGRILCSHLDAKALILLFPTSSSKLLCTTGETCASESLFSTSD